MENLQGLDELNLKVLERGLCAACGACLGLCPYLTAFKGKTVILDRCTVEHGRCYTYCPMTEFDSEKVDKFVFGKVDQADNLGQVLSIIASRSHEPRITSVAQGGGTVSALLSVALTDRVIEAAVLAGISSEDGYPSGQLAITADEIVRCAGSKYVGSHSLRPLRKALDRGFQGIGVVGLPCQVRALRKMQMYDLKNEDLKRRIPLVIGLFCNWAFISRDFAEYLVNSNLGQIHKMHIPPPPANSLELETDEGLRVISLDELRPLIQDACWHCPDMTSEFADISVGMHEGKPGWNTLIVRTETGQRMVRNAEEQGWIETAPFSDASLEHLEEASLNKKRRESAWKK